MYRLGQDIEEEGRGCGGGGGGLIYFLIKDRKKRLSPFAPEMLSKALDGEVTVDVCICGHHPYSSVSINRVWFINFSRRGQLNSEIMF